MGKQEVKARESKRIAQVNQLRIAFELYNIDHGDFPEINGGVYASYCLGKSSSETCWDGHVSGNDALNTQMENYISLDDFGSVPDEIGSGYIYNDGKTSLTGCNSNYVVGRYILWRPKEDSMPLNQNDCPGESVVSCCGFGTGLCGFVGAWYCALPLD